MGLTGVREGRTHRLSPSYSSSSFSFSKGQLTVEALMLGALALSLLFIAALAVSRLQYAQADLFSKRTLQMELEGLGQYVDEICVLGVGNARTMALSGTSLELHYDDANHQLVVSRGTWTSSRPVICPVTVDPDASFGGMAYLWYEENPVSGGPSVVISPTAHS
jgi:hypothetical protein